ncbi:MAG: threonine-phosphate decarboxylase [Lachnospiraceae bacterium]|nr:threonine-phosphate decarboxylase [Lachnospiraceae bacterium]
MDHTSPYLHGGDIYSQPVQVDFSANVSPLGMPDGVKQALMESLDAWSAYPDPRCRELAHAIAKKEQVPTDWVVCGNGAADLIYRLVHVIKPKRALLAVPCFSEYEKALEEVGAEVCHYIRRKENEFALEADFLTRIEQEQDLQMIFLCQPNNPTGDVIQPKLLGQILAVCEQRQIVLVLDECFLEFLPEYESYHGKPEAAGVVILKAFTKLYAMAGLRLGYTLCSDVTLNARLWQYGPCWNVSVPAQIAGVAALRETAYVDRVRRLVAKERDFLKQELQKIGFTVYPSGANFLLFYSATPLKDRLLEKGIAIRDCANYRGLEEGYYRVAVRTRAENQMLIRALRESLRQQDGF